MSYNYYVVFCKLCNYASYFFHKWTWISRLWHHWSLIWKSTKNGLAIFFMIWRAQSSYSLGKSGKHSSDKILKILKSYLETIHWIYFNILHSSTGKIIVNVNVFFCTSLGLKLNPEVERQSKWEYIGALHCNRMAQVVFLPDLKDLWYCIFRKWSSLYKYSHLDWLDLIQ